MDILQRKYKLYSSFILIGIVLCTILPTSCSCNCSSSDGIGGDWNPGGIGVKPTRIAFISDRDGVNDIYVMYNDGSEPGNVTEYDTDSNIHSLSWSPDGNRMAFVRYNRARIVNINDKNGTTLGNNVVLRDYALSWSPDNNLIAFETDGEVHIRGVEPAFNSSFRPTNGDYHYPEWSPDGTKIALTYQLSGLLEIHVTDPDGSNEVNLTGYALGNSYPKWSPDGSKIAYECYGELMVMNSDGSSHTVLSIDSGYWVEGSSISWSPDGSKIVFETFNEPEDIYVIDSDGANLTNLTNNPNRDIRPCWSPYGTEIAFQSNRDGNWEIYVANLDGTRQTNVTNSQADDTYPVCCPLVPT